MLSNFVGVLISKLIVFSDWSFGHVASSCFLKFGSIGGFVSMVRLNSVGQWDRPKVCAPERATKYVASNFLDWKSLNCSSVRSNGTGRLSGAVALKVRLSLLPNGTSKSGPPSCTNSNKQMTYC